jgi:BlaI family transcriptional regulator, penicillinase repressor
MARQPSTHLTPLELEIMKILWADGPATVEEVRQRMPGEPKPAYTTVQTMLNLLEKKSKAKRKLVDRAYVYRASETQTQARTQTLTDLINRMFGGSAEELVMGLLETRHLTPEKLAKLQRAVKKESNGTL